MRPRDELTAEVEAPEVRTDKPMSQLRMTITKQDGTVAVDGTALVRTDPLP